LQPILAAALASGWVTAASMTSKADEIAAAAAEEAAGGGADTAAQQPATAVGAITSGLTTSDAAKATSGKDESDSAGDSEGGLQHEKQIDALVRTAAGTSGGGGGTSMRVGSSMKRRNGGSGSGARVRPRGLLGQAVAGRGLVGRGITASVGVEDDEDDCESLPHTSSDEE
jgi:hypothetical protein